MSPTCLPPSAVFPRFTFRACGLPALCHGFTRHVERRRRVNRKPGRSVGVDLARRARFGCRPRHGVTGAAGMADRSAVRFVLAFTRRLVFSRGFRRGVWKRGRLRQWRRGARIGHIELRRT